MPATDLSLLIDAARAAGQVASGFTGTSAQSWDKPDGAGPVTEADLAVNACLEEMLPKARPAYGWLSEETPDTTDRLSASRVFIVDPIDGTQGFMQGSDYWAHSLAIAEAGVVTAAVVFLPMRDQLFAAAAGEGATLNGVPIAPTDRAEMDGSRVLTSKLALSPKNWKNDAPRVERAYRPSLAYRMAAVAEGRFDAILTLRSCWEWDVAAGDLILREAGARVTDRVGQQLEFNNPHPAVNGVVAGGQSLHTQLIGALAGA
ncbi:MAG: 3'(2'),5'-bisphosphate nucleotidase CysQ [Pseudomonadota bacterium]